MLQIEQLFTTICVCLSPEESTRCLPGVVYCLMILIRNSKHLERAIAERKWWWLGDLCKVSKIFGYSQLKMLFPLYLQIFYMGRNKRKVMLVIWTQSSKMWVRAFQLYSGQQQENHSKRKKKGNTDFSISSSNHVKHLASGISDIAWYSLICALRNTNSNTNILITDLGRSLQQQLINVLLLAQTFLKSLCSECCRFWT